MSISSVRAFKLNFILYFISALFCSIGEKHAQAILFPLIFASKNIKGNRPEQLGVAKDIIDKIRDHSRGLVEEVELLSKELVSISMPWMVIWYEAIEKLMSMHRNVSVTQPTNIRNQKKIPKKIFKTFFFSKI